MKPSKVNLAFCEAIGWRIYKSNGAMYYERPGGNVYNHVRNEEELPGYVDDLNLVRPWERSAIEKGLPYAEALFNVVCSTASASQRRVNNVHPDAWAITATALQRTEALVQVFKKTKP